MEQLDLTFPQKNIFMVDLVNKNTPLNVIAAVLKIDKNFKEDILVDVINELYRINDAVRINVIPGESPKQIIKEYKKEDITITSLIDKNKDEIQNYLNELTGKEMDIYGDSLIYMEIIKTKEDSGMVYLKMHHIISDAWTFMQITSQLINLYNQMLSKGTMELNVPSYLEFINSEKEYINSEKYLKDEEFWKEYMNGTLEPVSLKEKSSKISSSAKRYSVTLDKSLNDKILSFAKENRVSPYTMMLSALATYVYRVKDVNEVVIGTPILNRSNFKEKNMLGCFISTIPMRIKITENMKFLDLIKETSNQTMSLFRHQRYPISKTIENIHKNSDVKGKIYNMVLSYQNARLDLDEESGISTEWIFSKHIQDELEIHVSDMDSTGILTINYDYLSDLFEEIEIEYLHTRLMAILENLILDKEVSVEDIRIMTKEEENKILYEFNNTEIEYPKDKTVVQIFEEQVMKTPNNIALVFEGKSMTYDELNKKANSLAHYLREKYKIEPNSVVGIKLDKSFELIISILSVLKLGACYMPIDVDTPNSRIDFMISDSNSCLVIDKELDFQMAFSFDNCNINCNMSWNDNVYIMYTSGTTGNPKGVIVTNRNIVRLIKGANYVDFFDNDKILQTGSTSFDASTFEYWAALFNGLPLYLIKKQELLDPILLEKYIIDNSISIMWLTAPLFNQMVEFNPKMFRKVRVILAGGDVLSKKHVNYLLENCPNITIINGYGPTENTTFSCCNVINNKIENKFVPIGKPISNSKCYIVNKKMQVLPIFCVGELVVGGDGVSKGYLNRPELTEEKFIENGRKYRTGDNAYFDEHGLLHFKGRVDNQVKIRGMRIELDEIKNVFMKIPNVKDCAVVVKDVKLGKAVYLYFTASINLDIEEIYGYLKENLLLHLIPTGIMQLDILPINRNGKIDKDSLPEIKHTTHIDNNDATYMEKEIIKIIQELFDISCNPNDNLFDLGIDSLSIIRFVTKINEKFNVQLNMTEVFNGPNMSSIANSVISCLGKNNIYSNYSMKVSGAQNSIFMKYMMDTESTIYNIPFEINLDKEKLDKGKLKFSIEKAVKNHPVLFSYFDINKGEVVPKYNNNYDFSVKYTEINDDEYIKIKDSFVKPFDLLTGPVFNIEMYVTSTSIHVLFNFHHIVFDGVSMLILLKEISLIYSETEIANEKLSFSEYIKNRKVNSLDIDFFKDMFKDELTINDLPYDRPRGKKIESEGNKLYCSIPNKLSSNINNYISENKFTLNSLMQAAFSILMSKYTYNEDITFGIAHSGRTSADLDNSVGMFVKTMPYREKIDWNIRTKDFVLSCQKKVLEVLSHDSITYEDIIKEIDIPRFNNRNPLFDVMFVCQSMNDYDIKIGDSKIQINEIKRNISKFDITFEVIPKEDNFDIAVEYRTSLFNESTIISMVKNYINILRYITKNVNSKLCDIDMISKDEKDLILDKFNDTKTVYPSEKTIHEIFESVVSNFKDKVAIKFNKEEITYNDLNKKANKLARYLIQKGVKKGDTIGVMIDKSSEYMIALIGILKSGAVYMPISNDMPDERIRYVLGDTSAKLLITTEKFDKKSIKFNKIYISIYDEKSDYRDITDDTNLNLEDISSKDKAYVMYTSGTTGTPKGITIIHRGIVRLLINTNLVNFSDKETMLVSGSITFDTSGFEIWGAMFYGMTLHFIEKKNILNPSYYEKYLIDNNITTTLIPTPIFNQLTEYNGSMFKNMNSLYVCGDVLLNNYSNEIIEKCPSLKFVNTYGPTENSVIATFEIVKEKTKYDISIGKPISNTTCYIVDKCGKICPIGVPGELYTGGDGLGLGYINKPDITKEKFIYYDEVNSMVYKTGDLASFNSDGKIKFMGRIDTQIKLRGQRIEILEITNKILEIDGVNECVVVLKEKKQNKYLVAYYTSKLDTSEKDIVKYLRKYLPTYMVPSKIVKLNEMPLNQNSKIDRKRLPDVDFDKIELIMPSNELQLKILEVYKQVIPNCEIGMNSNFFDIGGDSLLAMKLIGIMEENNIHVSYSDVFECPTPLDIYNKIKNIDVDRVQNFGIEIDNYDYSNINEIIKNRCIKNINKINGVLLTGATGFLGIHILDSLIEYNPKIKIFCLVRGKRGINFEDRLNKVLKFYFGEKYEDAKYKNNIIVFDGDITNPKIILNSEVEQDIVDNIDLVINCAAHVKHFGNEKVYEEINIKGVNNIADFCIRNNKKLLHISTLSVSGNILEGGQISQSHIAPNTIYDEKSFYIGQNLNNVYALSKFIAERNILEKIDKENLNATIVRVGNLTGRFSDGKFQVNYKENAFLNRIKTFKNLGFIPRNILDLDVEFSPVDLTSKAIVSICNMEENNVIYNVYNKNHIKLKEIIKILESIGFTMKIISKEKMTSVIKDIIKDKIKRNSISGIIQDLNYEKELKYESSIKISGNITNEKLEKNGFIWPLIDKEYILKFFDKTGIIDGKENLDGNK